MLTRETLSWLKFYALVYIGGKDKSMDAAFLPKLLELDGEVRSGRIRNGFLFSTKGKMEQCSTFMEHLECLLAAFEPKKRAILRIRRKGWGTIFSCTYYTTEDDVEFVLTSDAARRIAVLGSGLDLNGYCGMDADD